MFTKAPAILLAAALSLSPLTVLAETLIEKSSPDPVPETMDRLEEAVRGAGATVFARVDHGAGAASIDADLPPSQLLIFGNPKIGTPAMQANIQAGLDLPLRVLVYQDSSGATRITYRDPADFANTHGLPGDAEYLTQMQGALNRLTDAAAGAL